MWWIISWIAGPVGRYVAIGILAAVLLSYGGCQIRGCVMAEHKAAVLEKTIKKTQEVQDADKETQEKVHGMSDAELADFIRRGGVQPKGR